MKDETRARIGQQLRVVYGDLMNQGVPERFSELLKQLDDDAEPDEKSVAQAPPPGLAGASHGRPR